MVGFVNGAAPTSGTFAVGDFAFDISTTSPAIWACTAAGTPGTWSKISGGGNAVQIDQFPAQSGTTVTLSHTPTQIIHVSKNGVVELQTTHWTLSGSTITFSNTLSSDDIQVVYAYNTTPFNSSITYNHEEFSPASSSTTITLSQTPGTVGFVARNGVIQRSGTDYSISAATLTFTTAFGTGENVIVGYSTGGGGSGNASTLQGYGTTTTSSANLIPVLNGNGLLPAAMIGPFTVLSAATLNLQTQSFITVTGTTTVTDLSNPPAVGTAVVLTFQSAGCQITSGNHWHLVQNFTSVAGGQLLGTIDSSGNFVEHDRTAGQGIQKCIWRSAVSAGSVNVSSTTSGVYVASGLTGITTPTILATDQVHVHLSGCSLISTATGSGTSSITSGIAIDRGGTKISTGVQCTVNLPATQYASSDATCEYIETPGAGSFTYNIYLQTGISGTGQAQLSSSGNTSAQFYVEVWR